MRELPGRSPLQDWEGYSQSCPKWATEKEVQEVKIKQKLSYPEAHKLVEVRIPRVGVSDAAAFRQVKHCSTQTEPQSPPVNSPKSQAKKCPNSPDHNLHQFPLLVKNVISQKPLKKC